MTSTLPTQWHLFHIKTLSNSNLKMIILWPFIPKGDVLSGRVCSLPVWSHPRSRPRMPALGMDFQTFTSVWLPVGAPELPNGTLLFLSSAVNQVECEHIKDSECFSLIFIPNVVQQDSVNTQRCLKCSVLGMKITRRNFCPNPSTSVV